MIPKETRKDPRTGMQRARKNEFRQAAYLEDWLCVLIVNQQPESVQDGHAHTRPGHVKSQLTCQGQQSPFAQLNMRFWSQLSDRLPGVQSVHMFPAHKVSSLSPPVSDSLHKLTQKQGLIFRFQ